MNKYHDISFKEAHMIDRILEKILDHFKRQQASGVFPGGQMVVRRHGNVILNESIGIARGNRPNHQSLVEVRPETLFSTSIR